MGLEPMTFSLGPKYSIQLNYGDILHTIACGFDVVKSFLEILKMFCRNMPVIQEFESYTIALIAANGSLRRRASNTACSVGVRSLMP